jgi:hypothetical protein
MDQIVEKPEEDAPKVKGIDWWREILDIWDQPIPIEGKGGETMTLRFVVIEALGGGYQGEDTIKGEERATRWSLATRIKELVPGRPLKLKSEEITTIKTVVNKRWPQSFIVAQVYKLIDPGEK